MRKLLSLLGLMCFVCIGLQAQQTMSVQGVPRQVSTLPKALKSTGISIDASKIKYYVGEGSKTSVLVIRWNDGRGAENLVWGYKWEDAAKATGDAMLRAIAKADPRFYMLVYGDTQYGSAIGGFGFDLNGNRNIGLKKGDEEKKADEEGLIHTSAYDFDDYTAMDATDHWASGWYSNGFWSYYTADSFTEEPGFSSVGASTRVLTDGSLDLWSFSSFSGSGEAAEINYYFYVPTPETGICLPDEITLPISDGGVLPTILGCNGETAGTMLWTIQDKESQKDNTLIKTIRSTKDAFNGAVTFAGNKTGDAYVYFRTKIGNSANYFQSNTCKITVTAPEKPITKIAFQQAEMESRIKQTVENPLTLTPSNATYTALTYTSSNKEVASVSTAGKITTTATEGETIITATSVYDENVTASFKLTVKCQKAVEKIELGGENKVIEIEFKDIYCPVPVITPADADYTDVTYLIADPDIASFYQTNIIAKKVGETTMTVTAKDGKGASTTVKLIVKERDHSPYAGYQDGTFILNEAWFGHENGDMNFLTEDKELMYRVYDRENPGEAFGATSCYGMIYADKFFVISKQPKDGGDSTPGGGRLVVMNAKTLKKIAGFDVIGGGDGRAIVGVNPDKVYISTTAGVVVFDVKNLKVGDIIEGTQGASLYNGQTGDMVKAGKYVFAIQQSKGTNIIDTETDKLVKCIENSKIQGITQGADGSVWLGSTHTLERLNPETLTIEETLQLPTGAEISCSWGAWRPTPFCASHTKNILYWSGGSSVMYGGAGYYRYEIGTDISTIKPFFSVAKLPGATEGKLQTSYGTPRYDDRTDELIVMTTQKGSGTDYEHNWIHIVNGTTGELKKTIKLKQYYWFQAMPIFPDKYVPEVNGVESTLSFTTSSAPTVIDLTDKVTDKDNLTYNISKTLKSVSNESIATATLEGNTLTVTPKAIGETTITLAIESNGVVVEKNIHVVVSGGTGINDMETGKTIYCKDNMLSIYGYEGYRFIMYNSNGQAIGSYKVNSDRYNTPIDVARGIYLLNGHTGKQIVSAKIIVE